jgi:hypothetical protein
MKIIVPAFFLFISISSFAESPCDLRPGTSIGVKVIEFVSGHVIHSKMPLRESSPDALLEEILNLQDMGICEEKIIRQKCILKFEKVEKINYISLMRGTFKWNTWNLKLKEQAQDYVKNLKKAGFCS